MLLAAQETGHVTSLFSEGPAKSLRFLSLDDSPATVLCGQRLSLASQHVYFEIQVNEAPSHTAGNPGKSNTEVHVLTSLDAFPSPYSTESCDLQVRIPGNQHRTRHLPSPGSKGKLGKKEMKASPSPENWLKIGNAPPRGQRWREVENIEIPRRPTFSSI